MDREKAKQLNALIWRDRLKLALPLFLIVLILAGLVYMQIGKRDVGSVQAQVESWSRAQTDDGAGRYIIWVTLENGEQATATASRYGRPPRQGERIILTKSETVFGTTRLIWKR